MPIKKPAIVRFREKWKLSETTFYNGEACWDWTARKAGRGYAHFWFKGKMRIGHKWAYEYFVGPVPEGLVLDHLCRNTICVNPAHLEPVTQQVNILRGKSSVRFKTECKRGHPYTEENLYVGPTGRGRSQRRQCRACRRIANKKSYHNPNRGLPRTECQRGHLMTEANTYRPKRDPNSRECRECQRINSRKRDRRMYKLNQESLRPTNAS